MIPVIDLGTIIIALGFTFAVGFLVGFIAAAYLQVLLDRKKNVKQPSRT